MKALVTYGEYLQRNDVVGEYIKGFLEKKNKH
jgi:hypothetical protein